MTDKGKEKARTGGRKRRALNMQKAPGTETSEEPVKSFTMSDVLKDPAKWLTVNVFSGGKFASVEYTRRRVLVFIRKISSALVSGCEPPYKRRDCIRINLIISNYPV
jgi:hypothetical protein